MNVSAGVAGCRRASGSGSASESRVVDAAAGQCRYGPAQSVQGSQDFLQTLIVNDLVDEYRLMIFPLIPGFGRKLFARGSPPAGLKLTKSRTSDTGVLMVWHERAEMASIGSFAPDQ